jgi:hypothetical protein
MRALEIWCQRVTSSYANVDVTDLSTSFSDGLAFCAIIHHFRPDLIDFDALKPAAVLENNALAFKTAEDKLGIPALLDPEDMADPDKFSVATYLAQFYHMFKDDDDSRNSSPKPRLLRGSESSETGSSGEGTPLGTPTLLSKKPLFSPKDLLDKYGEEIFSKSADSSPAPVASPLVRTPQSPVFSQKSLIEKYGEEIFSKSNVQAATTKSGVAAVCKEFEIKNRISSFEKQQA